MSTLIGVSRKKLGRAVNSHLQPTSLWADKQITFLTPKEWLDASHPDVIKKFARVFYYVDGNGS